MSHEMTKNDTAMYYNTKAWHGLGTVVEELYHPIEALSVAGLDWNVIKSDTVVANWGGNQTHLSNKVANIRSDTGECIGLVGANYQALQNSELAEIAYAIAGDDTKVETMGSLRNGSRVYCLINMGSFDASKNDTVEQYMLLCNGHDGMLAFSGLPTSVRVVCANTLNQALDIGSKNMIRITHAGDMADKINGAKQAMKTYTEISRFFEGSVEQLTKKTMTSDDVKKFWCDIYGMIESPIVVNPQNEKDERNYQKAIVTLTDWADTFDNEYKIAGATAWNAANAVTNWIQHKTAKRGRKASAETRIDRNLFGKNSENSVKVMKKALALTA